MWIGKDLLRSSSLTPCSSYSRWPRTMSIWLLSISTDQDFTTSVRNLTTHSKDLFSCVHLEFLVFQFVPVVSCPVTGNHWEESGSLLFIPSLQVFIHIGKISSEPSFLQDELFQLSQPFFIGEMLKSVNHLPGPLLDSPQYVYASLVLGTPELDPALQMLPHQYWAERKDHLPQYCWQHSDIAVTGMWHYKVLSSLFQ